MHEIYITKIISYDLKSCFAYDLNHKVLVNNYVKLSQALWISKRKYKNEVCRMKDGFW